MTYPILGIDISKSKCDVALLLDNGKFRHKVFPNTSAGFSQLSAWLTKHKVEGVHACLEATGTYADPLALYLFEAGHVVSVVNSAKIKAYAQSQLSRTKTDKADATLIAQFCQERQPPAWQPLPQERRDLQAMVRRLESLQEMRQMEGNRLEAGASSEMVRDSLVEYSAYLNQKIAHTEALIRDHISSHPKLRGQRQRRDGRAAKGERAFDKAPRNYGAQTSLIGAISLKSKIMAAMTVEGAVDTLCFNAYAERILGPQLKRGDLMVLDNLGAHKASRIEHVAQGRGALVLWLPPYSPDFSPIEQYWSKIKTALRATKARTQ